jgi:hypothetical protein
MVQCALSMTMHAMTIVIQEKTRSYTKCALGDDFIPLSIDTYDCFHSCFNSFFISYVQVIVACH